MRVLDSFQDKYSGVGTKVLDLDGALFKTSLSGNDVYRAVSLLKTFGNAVFISESDGQGDRLAVETLRHLGDKGSCRQAVWLDMAVLAGMGKEKAKQDFQGIIRCLRDAGEKIGLIAANLSEILKDEGVGSIFQEAIKLRPIPILGITDLAGFRKLEERPVLSGSLQFVLAGKEGLGAKRRKSVLIIGATSLFGKAVYELFSREYENVRGTGFRKAASSSFDKLDVTSEEEVKIYFSGHPGFDIVIYIAGEANADVAEKEKERARLLNAAAVASISRYAKNCSFVYISSEYVFDGNSAPYGSGSRANPINYYGQTKLEGEQISLKNFSNALVLRLGALYGYNGPDDKETTVSKLIASMEKSGPLNADNIQVKHPILLEDAARTLLKLIDYGARGIYQTNGPEGLNKEEMARRVAAVWNEKPGRVFSNPIVGIGQAGAAGKPRNTHMVNVDTPRPFDEGIRYLLIKAGKA